MTAADANVSAPARPEAPGRPRTVVMGLDGPACGLLGSVVSRLVADAPCDVLVVT